MEQAVELAKGKLPVAVWTFDSLPKGDILTDNTEKCALFAEAGVDYAVFEDFARLRNLDGETFFRNVIAKRHHPWAVVCGYNFRFGKNAAWTSDALRMFATDAGIGCTVVPYVEQNGAAVSSTTIRNLITAGDVERASTLLGRNYSVTLPVVHGRQLGRTIGHPTINQILPPGRIAPARGVYRCIVEFTDKAGLSHTKNGICNIGSRPTVNSDSSDITLETYIFDYSGDLYDVVIKTSFCEKLRDEKKFSSVEELAEQIRRDEETARERLHGRKFAGE